MCQSNCTCSAPPTRRVTHDPCDPGPIYDGSGSTNPFNVQLVPPRYIVPDIDRDNGRVASGPPAETPGSRQMTPVVVRSRQLSAPARQLFADGFVTGNRAGRCCGG